MRFFAFVKMITSVGPLNLPMTAQNAEQLRWLIYLEGERRGIQVLSYICEPLTGCEYDLLS